MIKDLGQNFLVDIDVLDDIISAAELRKDDIVLEIGAGKGILTDALAERVKRVVAIELDQNLVDGLQKRFAERANIEIIRGDALRWISEHRDRFTDHQWKIVTNLPYGITSRVLRLLLEHEPRPELVVFMVQKEVAERVCAKPGAMSLLSLAVQWFGSPEIIRVVPPESFDPAPEVESAILRIRTRNAEELKQNAAQEKRAFQLARIGFASRRKQLHNQLAAGLHISAEAVQEAMRAAGVAEKARAQELSIEQWKKLATALPRSSIQRPFFML